MATQSTPSTSSATHHPTLDTRLINQGYSLVATQESDKFRNLYGFGIYGANLEDAIFEFGAEDTFFTFSLPENIKQEREEAHRLMSNEPGSTGSRNIFPSETIGVIARSGNQPPVIFFELCDCPSCKLSTDVDPLKLQPISVNFQITTGATTYMLSEFPFRPTCKEDYIMGLQLSKNLKNVLYYTNCWTKNSTLADFITHLRSIPKGAVNTPTAIKLSSAVASNDTVDDNRSTLLAILQDALFHDFWLLSNDGIKFKCHRNILSAQSEELKRIIVQKQTDQEPASDRDKLQLTEDGETIRAFLNWIYFKGEVLISSSFEVASGLLRLGHEYHLPKLVAAAVKVLSEKIISAEIEWNNPISLWKLYKFARLVDKIDAVVRLKIAIVKKLAKNMANKKLEKLRSTATEEMKVLNEGEPLDSAVASDFILELVDLGKFDE